MATQYRNISSRIILLFGQAVFNKKEKYVPDHRVIFLICSKNKVGTQDVFIAQYNIEVCIGKYNKSQYPLGRNPRPIGTRMLEMKINVWHIEHNIKALTTGVNSKAFELRKWKSQLTQSLSINFNETFKPFL